MYGFKLRYVKKSVLLLAALIALILAWSDLSHAFFTLITACAAVVGFIGWSARNAWTQTSEDVSRSARVATRPRRERKSRAQARSRRAQELHPEETVEVRGRHLVTGLPTAVELHSEFWLAVLTGPDGARPSSAAGIADNAIIDFSPAAHNSDSPGTRGRATSRRARVLQE